MAQNCRIALIVAVADNGVIGEGNSIPWKCSSDMRYFRRVTMGKPVIMGRRTWQSLKGPLQGRENIVVSRDPAFEAPGAHRVTSIDRALALAMQSLKQSGAEEIMVIGGGTIYQQMLENSLACRIYKTEIHAQPEGDTRFPTADELRRSGFVETSREFHEAGPKDDADHSFVILERHINS